MQGYRDLAGRVPDPAGTAPVAHSADGHGALSRMATVTSNAETSPAELYAALVPSAERLRRFAARVLVSLHAEVVVLREKYASSPVAGTIGAAAERFGRYAETARQAVQEGPERELDSLIADLRGRTGGRTHHEQLLSVHLNAAIVEDALRHLAAGHGEDAAAAVEPLLGWQEGHDLLRDALKALFEIDNRLDDRLAMWGRRIAGDQAVWARRIVGVEPGRHADEVREGADEIVEPYVAELFAQHSRRMNALELAA